ncbi:MAG: NAD(P)/FAD-dependent oxidoreductase [Chitinophagaceae bacterium]
MLTDVIIVGAGACGLIMARKLSQAGMKVVILEGRDRLGGRIHTLEHTSFAAPLEAGAEFIHGKLPVTMELLKEAGIQSRVIGGDSWRFIRGQFTQDDDGMEKGELVTKRLHELKEDITVASFLQKYFPETAYEGLRNSVKGFVEGYDAANINRASAFSLRKEWVDNEDWEQYRVNGGYIQMIRFLEDECKKNGCLIYPSSIVKEIKWSSGHVEVTTDTHQRYTGRKIITTIPLGVICSENNAKASIHFSPSLPDKWEAMKALGFGGVIKILLLFKHAFWKDHSVTPGKSLRNMGWLFSEAPVPTWWTQVPDDSNLLTGWLAGPKSEQWKDADDSELLGEALNSLCMFFSMNRDTLHKLLVHSQVINWLADPFSLGAYSYATPESAASIKRISEPVEDTLFFAGEAFNDGPEIGTVEGALANGLRVADLVLGKH